MGMGMGMGVGVGVFITLHKTAQPGTDILIFRMDPPYRGSVIATVRTSSTKARQRRHTLSTLSLTA